MDQASQAATDDPAELLRRRTHRSSGGGRPASDAAGELGGEDLPVVPPRDQPLDVLDAFLNNTQEDAAAFMESFLALSAPQVAASMMMTSDIEAGELQSAAARVASSRGHEGASASRHTEEAKRCGAVSATSACMEDLEVVELDDGVHTGAMVRFWDTGATNVSTAYDNFVDDGAEDLIRTIAALTASVMARNTSVGGGSPVVPHRDSTGAATTVDELLSFLVDDEAPISHEVVADIQSSTSASGELPAGVPAAILPSSQKVVDEEDKNSSSASSLSLPGLEGEEHVARAAAPRVSPPADARGADVGSTLSTDLQKQLRAVISDADDCVHEFHLDPTFDYDADRLGYALRLEEVWRGS